MRKGIVVYYSQSGSTKKIAQSIHRGMSQRLERCDIARLKEVQSVALKDYDLIGLGSPVWGSKPSINVQTFIQNIDPLAGKQCFFFCTHGTLPGTIISEAVKSLRGKGLAVIGWANWYGSVFIPNMPKPYYTDGHPDAIDLKEAEAFGIEIAERSQKIAKGNTSLIPELPQGDKYIERYGGSGPTTRRADLLEAKYQPFKVNEKKCTACGICADNCPMDNIDIFGSLPVFKKVQCARCWNCEQVCPEGAIEFNFDTLARITREYSSGYFEKESDIAEAKGYFRRLVPKKDIGWATPWYKISGHPRLEIP